MTSVSAPTFSARFIFLFILLFLFTFRAAARADTTTALEGHWPFEEGSGLTTADLANGNDGTVDADIDWVAGQVGSYAVELPSPTPTIEIADSADLQPAALSVAIWIKGAHPGNFKYLVSKYLGGGGAGDHPSFAIYTHNAGGLKFAIDTGGNAGNFALSPDAGSGVWDGNWHHVVGTFDGSTIRIYLDGQEVDSGTASATTIVYTADPLWVNTYDGSILGVSSSVSLDDLRIYSRALTRYDITQLYQNFTLPETSRVYLTNGTSWTVPSDWNSSNNSIEVIGGGAGGVSGGSNDPGPGGGGGAYSKITNLALTPGANISYSIGAGGATDQSGGDTYFNGANCAASSVCAKGGAVGAGINTPGGVGGAAASGVGTVKYSGGNGGDASAGITHNATGGGGAGGPNGNGANGGDASGNGAAGSTGGGGGGGGSDGSSNNGDDGGAGGDNYAATGGGAGGTVGSPGGVDGTAGGGGGGAYGDNFNTGGDGAGDGGHGTEWDAYHGSGGGGAGMSYTNVDYHPGNGGFFGGGGGGGWYGDGDGGQGAQGIIVITYTTAKTVIKGARIKGAQIR